MTPPFPAVPPPTFTSAMCSRSAPNASPASLTAPWRVSSPASFTSAPPSPATTRSGTSASPRPTSPRSSPLPPIPSRRPPKPPFSRPPRRRTTPCRAPWLSSSPRYFPRLSVMRACFSASTGRSPSPELDRLSDMLVPSPLPEHLYPPPPLVTSWVAAIIKSRIEGSKSSQEFSRRLVETALCKYAQQTGQHYELHLACGIHVFIKSEAFWHINFWHGQRTLLVNCPFTSLLKQRFQWARTTNSSRRTLSCAAQSNWLELIGGCRACTVQYKKLNHPIDKEHHGGLDDYDDEIGNGDDYWDYKFPQLVDFIMFDAEKVGATVRHIEKRFPPRPDGDENADNIWITEM